MVGMLSLLFFLSRPSGSSLSVRCTAHGEPSLRCCFTDFVACETVACATIFYIIHAFPASVKGALTVSERKKRIQRKIKTQDMRIDGDCHTRKKKRNADSPFSSSDFRRTADQTPASAMRWSLWSAVRGNRSPPDKWLRKSF